ncbi:hypothetical protein CYMTET_16443 [Cymbomonas tetramitiformis]|uniref:Uncharacterized protein n=1 Tax=Cymbomonas tetramitiformis TaxID=36881 RepID=A0AAE0G5R7_9CHLO|nr:hypothetical protein CYMTET_19864 [Cymbomonas tetramitiformis]KAK3275427.1 hypothetical protein CYMTET_16443 [Cymbomonas tetramitiformis]|eukprot:gene9346-11073_t
MAESTPVAQADSESELHRKLDILLGKEPKRPPPGANCDFRKFGRGDLSTKRTWELVDELDAKFFEIICALKKGGDAGMKVCDEKALTSRIAFVDGWAVANHFEKGSYEDDLSAADREKLKRERATAKDWVGSDDSSSE